MRWTWCLGAWMGAACVAPGEDPVRPDGETDAAMHTDTPTQPDTDVLVQPDTDPPPDFSAPWDAQRQQELAEALLTISFRLGRLDATPVDAALDRMSGLLIGTCNDVRTQGDTTTWQGICFDDTGRSTFGVLSRTTLTDEPFPPAASARITWALQAADPQATVPDTWRGDGLEVDGIFFVEQDRSLLARVSGPFREQRAIVAGHSVRHTMLGGPTTDGDAAAGTWVADGLVPDALDITRVRHANGVIITLARGAISGWPGPVVSAHLDDVLVTTGGDLCTAEPHGAWSLLHADGTWYTLTFDPDTACDGCGTVTAADQILGPLCPDEVAP